MSKENYHILNCVAKDIPKVADIEENNFGLEGLSKKELTQLRCQTGNIFLVYQNNIGEILGYIIYKQTRKNTAEIIRLAVDPLYHEEGIGSLLVRHAGDKYNNLKISVSDKNLRAHLFFKHLGFKATKVEYDSEGDRYLFEKLSDPT